MLHLCCCSGFFLVVANWGYSSLQCVAFSLQWLLLLPSTGCKAHRLQYMWLTGFVALQHVGSSWTRDRTCDCCIGRWILYHWATREAPLPVFLIIAILVGVQWYLIVVLIFISWMANVVEHLLTCLFAICICSLEKCLLRSFEACVILYRFCLRRKKFGRTTVAFLFFFSRYPFRDTCKHPFHTSFRNLLRCHLLKRLFLIVLFKEALISYLSFQFYPVLFSESTCHSLI